METERRSQRYPSDRPLQIRCETWTEFVDAYARDVCRGGMFVRTDEAPEVLSTIEIRLQLPDDSSVTWWARVVHVITPEQAAGQKRAAGVGVEFTELDAEQKLQIQQLVDFARNQQLHADPDASFTRALLENSPSMPASEVAARLSMRANARSGQHPLPGVRLEAEDFDADSGGTHAASDQRRVLRPASASLQRMLAVRAPSAALDGGRESRAARARGQTGPIDPSAAPARAASRPLGEAPARPPTGPLAAAPARAPTGPVSAPARPATGPLAAAPARAHSGAVGAAPRRPPTGPLEPQAARPPAGPLTGTAAQGGGRAASGPLTPGARLNSGPLSAAEAGPAEGAPPARPTDMQRLKLVLNALAHKHHDDAARIAREMLVENPGDPQVLKWQAICFARMQLGRGDQEAAAEQYGRALQYDSGNREARDFMRDYSRDRRLHSLPFGRYFTKKK